VLHDLDGLVRAGVLTRRAGPSRAVFAALAVVAGVAAFVAAQARPAGPPRNASVVPGSLDWHAVTVDGVPVGRPFRPSALLYVLPSCAHCDQAVRVFVRETNKRKLPGLLIAGSSAQEAKAYQRKLAVKRPIAVDSARVFARSAGIRVVPTLVVVPTDGPARVLPIPAPAFVSTYVNALQ
jgi:hypothetical protein